MSTSVGRIIPVVALLGGCGVSPQISGDTTDTAPSAASVTGTPGTTSTAGSTSPAPVDLCAGDVTCTNVWELPGAWTIELPASGVSGAFTKVLSMDDLTGDGAADTLVLGGGGSRLFVVSDAPLQALSLPTDAAATLENVSRASPAGDVDGDGVQDLWVWVAGGGAVRLLMGPFSGTMDAELMPAHLELPSDPFPNLLDTTDFDGDGDLDLIVEARSTLYGMTVRIFKAPFTAASLASPDLELVPTCLDPDWDWETDFLGFPGDLTGDGVPDLHISPYIGGLPCPDTVLVSGQATGQIEIDTAGTSEHLLYNLWLGYGDQDGDGQADYSTGSSNGLVEVRAAPVDAAAPVILAFPWTSSDSPTIAPGDGDLYDDLLHLELFDDGTRELSLRTGGPLGTLVAGAAARRWVGGGETEWKGPWVLSGDLVAVSADNTVYVFPVH